MRQKRVMIAMICRVPLAYWKMRCVGAGVSLCAIALCVYQNIVLYTRLCMNFFGSCHPCLWRHGPIFADLSVFVFVCVTALCVRLLYVGMQLFIMIIIFCVCATALCLYAKVGVWHHFLKCFTIFVSLSHLCVTALCVCL